ncbi:MAG: hypothetical protein RLZ02_1695, partial [Actinomycetota bacterium]
MALNCQSLQKSLTKATLRLQRFIMQEEPASLGEV